MFNTIFNGDQRFAKHSKILNLNELNELYSFSLCITIRILSVLEFRDYYQSFIIVSHLFTVRVLSLLEVSLMLNIYHS